MFCPVCESEYEEGIDRCPDDNSDLVPKLTPENTLHDGSEASFRVLQSVNAPAEAEMVNDILKQNGIRSVIRSGGDALSPLLSSGALGAAVLVDERDFDRAQELYSAFFGDDASPLTGGVTDEEADEDDD